MNYPKAKVNVQYMVTTHGKQTPERIVLHDTECGELTGVGDIVGVAMYWQRQGKGLGAHFIIDGEGNLGQGASSQRITWAVKGHNTRSIHIELIGYARWRAPRWLRNKRQLSKLCNLLAYLSDRWGIPLIHSTDYGVCMHRDFKGTGADHTDPGAGFPFDKVLRRAQIRQRRHRKKLLRKK